MNDDAFVDEDSQPDPELNRVTNLILGAAIQFHREIGPGYTESTYENALAIEINARNIRFVRQAVLPVMYRGQQVGEFRSDFLVEGLVVVELKAVDTFTPLFAAQVVSYPKATDRRLRLLLNFNVRKLMDGIRRIAR